MTVAAPAYSARIVGAPDIPVALDQDAGRIVFDSGRAPHVSARGIRLALADPDLLNDLDPRDARRLEITAGGRVFDLGIRRATPDRESAKVAVELASDEAILDDFAQLVDDDGAWALQSSLRDVCDYVLGKIGASLEPGVNDADSTAYWEVTNLLANPSLEVDAANWIQVGGNPTLARAALSSAPAGGYVLRVTAAAVNALVAPVAAPSDFSVVPGKEYTFNAYVITSGTGRMAEARLQWRNANGTVVVSTVVGTPVPTSSAGYVRPTISAVAPPGATHVLPYIAITGTVSGQVHFVDAAMFHEGDRAIPYHDGSVAPAGYTVAWQDVAHKSASTRTPLVERRPESLRWPAGTSALAFLHPLVQAAGFRLVCNESREWTLRDAGWREPGAQTYRYGVNIINGSEELTRDSDAWYDGAVFRYTWTDRDGIEQTRDDAFALTPTPSKVILREIRAPYPGPGRAQYAVQRAQGKGRTVTATKQAAWTETAEQTFSAILEGTPIQIGIAERVEFDLGQNEVTATSRTTDTPAGAIVLLPGTINALAGTINNL
ncbi:hypothetical protein E3V93_00140 [Microbacterium sp. 3H14]|nr:hypothetical protein [Microbacterium sp. 3H14]TFB15122.1 hypothetical protein E3V93_00030 [Microbacterium sp. 3H14]TFB15143.1 hypothetical protein E3V93_00140 [Microbacterium sp. 3H14]